MCLGASKGMVLLESTAMTGGSSQTVCSYEVYEKW